MAEVATDAGTRWRLTSVINGWPHREHRYDDIGVEWVAERPSGSLQVPLDGAALEALVDPAQDDQLSKPYARGAIRGAMTSDEADQLASYLLRTHDTATERRPVPVPYNAETHGLPIAAVPLGGERDAYELYAEDGYNLPFKVSGYYCVLDREPVAGPSVVDLAPGDIPY